MRVLARKMNTENAAKRESTLASIRAQDEVCSAQLEEILGNIQAHHEQVHSEAMWCLKEVSFCYPLLQCEPKKYRIWKRKWNQQQMSCVNMITPF